MTLVTTHPAVRELAHARVDRRTIVDRFLGFFALVLGGYAIGSKGFAYVGVSPIYIGEVSLLFGLVALWHTHTIRQLLRLPVVALLCLFMLIGAFRTLPFVPAYGLDALRDGVLWGYATFSFVLAGVLYSRHERLWYLVSCYRRFIPVFLVAAPIVWLTTIFLDSLARWVGTSVPMWPGTQVPIVNAKAGDLLVHLGGAAAFMTVGLAGNVRKSRIALLGLGVALTGLSRGGLLAFSLAFLFAFATRPRSRSAWALVTLFVAAAVFLAVTDLRLRYPGNDREVSFQQFTERFVSTAGGSGGQDLENTKSWRLAWWGTIVGYTILGDNRWAGKGYGINLATDDGFQVTDDDSLRSPHNATMTILARSGVIGLMAWLALLGTWSLTLVRAMIDARRRQDQPWAALFAFLLAYLMALFINASFDVYLEGPVGGIWFWSIFGIGIGATLIYRRLGELSAPTTGTAA